MYALLFNELLVDLHPWQWKTAKERLDSRTKSIVFYTLNLT